MYKLTDEQMNSLRHIINNLTVTGPVQGGMLNIAAGILERAEREGDKNDNQ